MVELLEEDHTLVLSIDRSEPSSQNSTKISLGSSGKQLFGVMRVNLNFSPIRGGRLFGGRMELLSISSILHQP